ncbi:MAG: hypothetical protein LLF92_03375 [Planctomycetaceae bacterium]|nr:hypothetical protein [Planctomycetaceae bacterium]
MNKIRQIKDLDKLLYGTTLIPNGINDVQVLNKIKKPLVLVNLRPHQCLNVIHYSLLQRICVLHKYGFYVTIVFYDRTIICGQLSRSIKNESDAKNAMDWLYDAFMKYDGIKQDCIEFIPESVLWKISAIHKVSLPFFCAMSNQAQLNIKSENGQSLIALSQFVDCLFGILYESILKPQFVFFGGGEKEIWRQARDRMTLCQALGIESYNHIPPVLITFPTISHFACGQTLGTDCEDDPFSYRFDISKLNENSLSKQYREQVSELASLTTGVKEEPLTIIRKFRGKYYGSK